MSAEGQVPVTQRRATSSSPPLWMRSGRFLLLNPFVPILIPVVTSNKSGPGFELGDRGSRFLPAQGHIPSRLPPPLFGCCQDSQHPHRL